MTGLDSDVPTGLALMLFAIPGFRCASPWTISRVPSGNFVVRAITAWLKPCPCYKTCADDGPNEFFSKV